MNLKKYFSYILLFVSFSTLAGDFRSSDWGDSISKTKTLESAELVGQDADALYYKTSIASIEMLTFFSYLNDALYSGAYLSQEKYMNKNRFIDDYNKISKLLTKKYGKPSVEDIIWLDEDSYYKDERNNWGLAISMGELLMRAIWKTDTTTIINGLRGDNFELNHVIFYEELASKERVQKLEEEKDLDLL